MASSVMPVPDADHADPLLLTILPQELIDKIYRLVFPTSNSGQLFEPTPEGQPWNTALKIYHVDEYGTWKHNATVPFAPSLFATCKKTHSETFERFWKGSKFILSSNLLVNQLMPSFAPFLKEITLINYFSMQGWSSVNDVLNPGNLDPPDPCQSSPKPGDRVKNPSVFSSLRCLKECPRLQAINIQLSIYNCQWQFVIADTLTPARPLLGNQARIHLSVKHCVCCDPHVPAFGIHDPNFGPERDSKIRRWPGHAREMVYWEWTSEARSEAWRIERFEFKDGDRIKRWGMQDYMLEYNDNVQLHGRTVALEKLRARGQALQRTTCSYCRSPNTDVPEDLRIPSRFWCQRCHSHLSCGHLVCSTSIKHCQIPPAVSRWVPPHAPRGVDELIYTAFVMPNEPHHGRADPLGGGPTVSTPFLRQVMYQFVFDIFGNPYGLSHAASYGIGVNKLDTDLTPEEFDALDARRDL